MKRLLYLLMALAPPLLAAESALVVKDYDVDSLNYYYPQLCAGVTGSCTPASSNNGNIGERLATTSGSSSATVTSVNSDSPFAAISIGDAILFDGVISSTTNLRTGTALRVVTAKTSDNSITVDSALTIPSAGSRFVWWRLVSGGTGAEDGWFAMKPSSAQNIVATFDQISTTGGLIYKVECRMVTMGAAESPTIIAGPTTVTTAGTAARVNLANEPWDQCRVGLKVTTADDDTITITGSTDDIDWKEYVNSYTLGGATSDAIDFTEDPSGTPVACAATVTVAASSTGSVVCTAIEGAMNTAGICAGATNPTNTYACSYSTTTHKFTISRSAGALAFDINWATGPNTLTSAKTVLGYSNADDTGSTSYVSDSATGESAEKTSTLTSGIYSGTLACVEVAAQMQGDATASTISCSYSAATGKITISATGITQLMILWNSGTNNATSADTALGFAADSTGALTYTGSDLGLDAANEVEKVTVTYKAN